MCVYLHTKYNVYSIFFEGVVAWGGGESWLPFTLKRTYKKPTQIRLKSFSKLEDNSYILV